MTTDGEGRVDADWGPPAATQTKEMWCKVGAAAGLPIVLLLISGFLYPEQARLYDLPHFVGVLKQIFYETPFQPLFLIIVLVPLLLAAARNVSWEALTVGGLLVVAVVMPFARFQSLDPVLAADPTFVPGAHNSVFQMAGPGNEMPTFVAVVVLLLMGGVTAMFWRPRVGGLIGLMAVVTMTLVWPTTFDNPPVRDGNPVIVFQSGQLLFGYYLAWAGAAIGVLGFSTWADLRSLWHREDEDVPEQAAVDAPAGDES